MDVIVLLIVRLYIRIMPAVWFKYGLVTWFYVPILSDIATNSFMIILQLDFVLKLFTIDK